MQSFSNKLFPHPKNMCIWLLHQYLYEYFNFSWAVLFVIKTFFFLNAPIQKFMHHFDFFSGIWSNPLYTCKHTYERYKFHVEPLSHLFVTPPSLKGEHLLNMAVLSKTYKYIPYNNQSFESRQHSSLVSIEIPSTTISLLSICVNTSMNSQ